MQSPLSRFKNDPTTTADDRALLIEMRAIAILRIAPLIIILAAMVMLGLALWLSDESEAVVRFCELVATGALGNLAPSIGSNRTRSRPQSSVVHEPRFTQQAPQVDHPTIRR